MTGAPAGAAFAFLAFGIVGWLRRHRRALVADALRVVARVEELPEVELTGRGRQVGRPAIAARGASAWRSAGRRRGHVLSLKQLPSPALGSTTARSATFEPVTVLATIRLPVAGYCASPIKPGFGAIAMPIDALSSTTFACTRLSDPADDRDPGAVHDVEPLVARRGARRRRAAGRDAVRRDHRVALRGELLAVEAVRHDPRPVEPPHRLHDVEVAARVGARVAELVVLGDHVVDHRVARIALADVEAGVGAPRRVRVLDRAPLRVERVDAVVAVAVRGHVRRRGSRARRSRRSR